MRELILKIKRRLWHEIVSYTRNTSLYPYIYLSYWHSFLFSNKGKIGNDNLYFAACPNPDAGIGHQLANWIAGYWWAKQFELKFAHIPFSSPQWEAFVGFGENELSVKQLQKKGFKKVRLPLFGQFNMKELERVKQIIESYSSEKVVFVCEQDQGYKEQYGVIQDIQHKFYTALSRKDDKLIYHKEFYNIAIHVRRGDIVITEKSKSQNLLMRWQNNNYFTNVLSNVLKTICPEKPIAIYLFSQGVESDFEDFKLFPNLHFCFDMSAQNSFLHMVYADLLITSKSSFSYKPALINNGIKICPRIFWHAYPDTDEWILTEEDGGFDLKQLKTNK